MIICSYCGENYKDCLDITLPSWKADKVIVYSDTDKFGIKMFEPSTDFNESCRRKILIIKRTLEEHKGQNVLYLDTDVFMAKPVSDSVFTHDILATRMVNRPERPHYHEVNAGVSFWRANDQTIAFCEEWLRLEAEYRKNTSIPYPEQRAFSDLVYREYDRGEGGAGNISENVYNFERDDDKSFIKGIKTYRPKLIHLKGKKWANPFILEFLRNSGIIK